MKAKDRVAEIQERQTFFEQYCGKINLDWRNIIAYKTEQDNSFLLTDNKFLREAL